MSEPSTPPASSVWAAGGVRGGLAPRAPDPAEKGGDFALIDAPAVQSRSSRTRNRPIAGASTRPLPLHLESRVRRSLRSVRGGAGGAGGPVSSTSLFPAFQLPQIGGKVSVYLLQETRGRTHTSLIPALMFCESFCAALLWHTPPNAKNRRLKKALIHCRPFAPCAASVPGDPAGTEIRQLSAP
ncbi:hypothetical protein Q8A67_022138 [Cirrhinus molitorella]|uniref:Uncharacterized protein n=1 Tax=Cirrhinus molitorella TaxID=172907 RepID=A0AA88P179_9TELE|nr:hypothetical protein Q8A67_022138 [Cirrhinus molitorella]